MSMRRGFEMTTEELEIYIDEYGNTRIRGIFSIPEKKKFSKRFIGKVNKSVKKGENVEVEL